MMPRAFLRIGTSPAYRRDAFEHGLRRQGYTIFGHEADATRPTDLLVIWNRYGHNDELAKRFEKAGARVVVAENGYLGREWRGEGWYALARNNHNGGGHWSPGGPERWAALGVELGSWKLAGREIIVLGTRGIGPPSIAEPPHWSDQMARWLRTQTDRPVRLRAHPGEAGLAPALALDLCDAWAVVTWGSGAALKALAMGVPVFYGFPRWIGGAACVPIEQGIKQRGVSTLARLAVFERVAWAMWSVPEIASGAAFEHLLGRPLA